MRLTGLIRFVVFHVLDPKGAASSLLGADGAPVPFVTRLVNKVQEWRVNHLSQHKRSMGLVADDDADSEYQWLNDTLYAFATTDNPTSDAAMSAVIRESVTGIQTAFGIDLTLSASRRAYVNPLCLF